MKTNSIPARRPGFAAAMREGADERRRSARSVQPLAWPQLRIARAAKYKNPYDKGVQDWNAFLNELGSYNQASGRPLVLGQLSCKYVTDVEFRRMLTAKEVRSGAMQDPSRAKRLFRRVAAEINDFAVATQRTVNEVEQALDFEEVCNYGGDVNFSELAGSARLDGQRTCWNTAYFSLGAIRLYGRVGRERKLGFHMAGNPELTEERQAFVDYLRQEQKLDVRQLNPEWEPHITFFETRQHLMAGDIALRYTERSLPTGVELGMPRAHYVEP